jgi:phospholipase D1/2
MHNTPTLTEEAWEGTMSDEVDNWIQEELYIHGKLLIVDDKTVVCGSSNLNDRSQLGAHDSELSIVMTDAKLINSTMNGQPYEASHHAATLRRYLWREHLGLLPPQDLDAKDDANAQPPDVPNDIWENDTYAFVEDPLSDELWEMWTSRASTNTDMFRQLFHADPDDFGKTPLLVQNLVWMYTNIVKSKHLMTTIDSFHPKELSQAISTTA